MRKIEMLRKRFESLKAVKLKDEKELDQKKVERYIREFAIDLEMRDFTPWIMYSIDEIYKHLVKNYTLSEIVMRHNDSNKKSFTEIAMSFLVDRCKDYNSTVKTITEALDIIERIKNDYNNSVSFFQFPYLEKYYGDIEKMFQKYEDIRISQQKFRTTAVYKKYFKNPIKNTLSVEEIQEKQRDLMKKLTTFDKTYLIFIMFIEDQEKKNIHENICYGFKEPKYVGSKIKLIEDLINNYPNLKDKMEPIYYELEWRIMEDYIRYGLFTTEKNDEDFNYEFRGW